jgi:hypothetical protein
VDSVDSVVDLVVQEVLEALPILRSLILSLEKMAVLAKQV